MSDELTRSRRHSGELEARREATRELLAEHYAHERILEQDYEDRLERVEAAGDDVDLEAVVSDLPLFDAEGRRVITPYPAGATTPGLIGAGSSTALATAPGQALASHEGEPLALQSSFGSVQRRGEWDAPRRIVVDVSFGDAKLDFRQARMQPGVTDVIVNVSLGSVKITVSPELPVSCVGEAVMGDFSSYDKSAEGLPEEAPRLRVSGKVFMGDVKIIARKKPR